MQVIANPIPIGTCILLSVACVRSYGNARADDRIALIARDSLDADEAVVYSSGDANVWEKRTDEDLDADEAVVYSSEDANIWE